MVNPFHMSGHQMGVVFVHYPERIHRSDLVEGHTVFHYQSCESFSCLMQFFSTLLALRQSYVFRLCILCLIQKHFGKLHVGFCIKVTLKSRAVNWRYFLSDWKVGQRDYV